VTLTAESGHATGAAGVVVVGAVVVVVGAVVVVAGVVVTGAPVVGTGDAVAFAEADTDAELDGLPGWAIGPVAGGLLTCVVVSGGTPSGRTLAAPRTAGFSSPPSNAPTAQMNSNAPTPSPAMAMTRRRRYTDGESGPLGSFTCGN
jgi:hypothetical protein